MQHRKRQHHIKRPLQPRVPIGRGQITYGVLRMAFSVLSGGLYQPFTKIYSEVRPRKPAPGQFPREFAVATTEVENPGGGGNEVEHPREQSLHARLDALSRSVKIRGKGLVKLAIDE